MQSSAAPVPVYDSAKARLQAIVEMQELWRYRFLIRNLITRDLKVRYKRSALGMVWVMMNPLLQTLVLTIAFSFLFGAKLGSTRALYPVFVLSGILVFSLFSQGTVAAMNNLVMNGMTLRRMYIPPSSFVVSSIGSALLNLVFAMAPFFVIAYVLHAPLSFTWLYLFVACIQATIFTLGVSLIISTMMVFFRDIGEIYTVLLIAYNYLTPVFYPVKILPPKLQLLETFNPMYLYVSAGQRAITEGVLPDIHAQLFGWAAAAIIFTIGWLLFTRLEDRFAYHF